MEVEGAGKGKSGKKWIIQREVSQIPLIRHMKKGKSI